MRRPLRQRVPVRRQIPTMRHARADGTPSAISLANASRLAKSGFGPRRPIATPQTHGCCDARQNPPVVVRLSGGAPDVRLREFFDDLEAREPKLRDEVRATIAISRLFGVAVLRPEEL